MLIAYNTDWLQDSYFAANDYNVKSTEVVYVVSCRR